MSNEQHTFLVAPGSWLGQGTVRFSESDDVLKFYSRWAVAHSSEGDIECTQTVEVEGGGEQIVNHLSFTKMTPRDFTIDLENAMLGDVHGKGVVDEKMLGWEFTTSEQGFEGFEIYERQKNNDYLLRAEYLSSDGTRTLIEGKLWKESKSCDS